MKIEDTCQEYKQLIATSYNWEDSFRSVPIHRNGFSVFFQWLITIFLRSVLMLLMWNKRQPEYLRLKIMHRTCSIFKNYDMVNRTLARHEHTIQKRWWKKNHTQRLKILLQAWPDMASVHRPDFQAFRREVKGDRETRTLFRDHYMWPYINQDDLCKPNVLLLLLNARGRNLPGVFAAGDLEAMYLGRRLGALKSPHVRGYIMVMDGPLHEEDYGKLVPRDLKSDWLEGDQKQISPGEGLLILEAQDRLLGFLVSCCQQILHDISATEMFSDRFPLVTEPPLKAETEVNGFNSLAIMASEAPYRIPAKLDFDRLISILSAKASAAKDHLWALREDPGYFFEHVREMKEHDPENVKDENGHTPFDGCEGLQRFWASSITVMLCDAYGNHEMYSQLRDEARHLQALQKLHESQIVPEKDLPEDYLWAILKFYTDLREIAVRVCFRLQVATASPPMRHLCVRAQPTSSSESEIVQISFILGKKISKVEGQLILLLSTLCEFGRSADAFRWTLVMDELERLLESEPRAKELISPYIAGRLSELSIISHCMRQLERYQPWARSFVNMAAMRQKQLGEDFFRRFSAWITMKKKFKFRTMEEIFEKTHPVGGKFNYPVGKRRSKENVEALRRAESKLDDFWALFDERMFRDAENIDTTALYQLLSQPRALQRTPEWTEPPSTQKSTPSSGSLPGIVIKPFSAFYISQPGNGLDHPRGCISSPQRHKVKTRKAASDNVAENDIRDQLVPDPPAHMGPPSQVRVDRRTYHVFRTLFFNPAATSTPTEIPWIDFVRAMVAVGFSAELLYGSVWLFCPLMNDQEQSIQFHEPHPRRKLHFTTARRFGRRLNRAFGWTGDTFIMKEN